MFAEGKGDIAHQLTSPDGLHWDDLGSLDVRTAAGAPISPGPYGTPTAWFEDGTWYLFYERGDQGVWLATSKDRRVWTNVQDTPVLAMGPEPYDRHAVAMNQVIKRDGVYYAFYHACDAQALEGLDHLHRPLARPGPLGKIPRQPDHRQQLLERHPRRHPPGRPALHDASRRQGVRQRRAGRVAINNNLFPPELA